ncbi:hypothetical protein NDU88_003642 [Pleurodeles waltl]|uniref:Uncharacterized protein n=1 Tax=Pleurodeles waltl TaxID=8319 RepID=A0AAV7SGJ6_PLEWA|nr:hypothetical protein NDU88_003642 [Pleurodeles waltl]
MEPIKARLSAAAERVPVAAVGQGGTGSGGGHNQKRRHLASVFRGLWRPSDAQGARVGPPARYGGGDRVPLTPLDSEVQGPRGSECGPSARRDNLPTVRAGRWRLGCTLLDGAGPWWSPTNGSAMPLWPRRRRGVGMVVLPGPERVQRVKAGCSSERC